MTSDAILSCAELSASYDGREVFCSVTLSLASGVYALQGANGIGKSTLLRLLAGAQAPDGGRVWINGVDLTQAAVEARKLLAYVPDECPVYPFMTGEEFLQFVAALKHARVDARVRELIVAFGLDEHMASRFDAMSLGTKKKMMLCAAWIGAPRVFLMDEPGNCLDLAARVHVIWLLRREGRENTIIFSAHDEDFVAATGATVINMKSLITPQHAAAH
jgi:ABC-2 type transport system ATP-binding protein